MPLSVSVAVIVYLMYVQLVFKGYLVERHRLSSNLDQIANVRIWSGRSIAARFVRAVSR